MRNLLFFILIILSFFSFSCSANPMDLVGTWILTDGEEVGYARTETIIFKSSEQKSGNTFTWTRVEASATIFDVAGTWSVSSDRLGSNISYLVKFSFKDKNGQDSNKSLFYAPVAGGMLFSDGSGKNVYQSKKPDSNSGDKK